MSSGNEQLTIVTTITYLVEFKYHSFILWTYGFWTNNWKKLNLHCRANASLKGLRSGSGCSSDLLAPVGDPLALLLWSSLVVRVCDWREWCVRCDLWWWWWWDGGSDLPQMYAISSSFRMCLLLQCFNQWRISLLLLWCPQRTANSVVCFPADTLSENKR